MGWPLEAVNALTERELSLRMARAPLWPRRLELLLIQMTNVLAQVHGNKTRMSDFDMFTPNPSAALFEAAHDIGSLVGSNVRKLGQGRK